MGELGLDWFKILRSLIVIEISMSASPMTMVVMAKIILSRVVVGGWLARWILKH